jgi:hypothetical protein
MYLILCQNGDNKIVLFGIWVLRGFFIGSNSKFCKDFFCLFDVGCLLCPVNPSPSRLLCRFCVTNFNKTDKFYEFHKLMELL